MPEKRTSAPRQVIDINRLAGLDRIEAFRDGGLRIGALVRPNEHGL